MKLEDTEKETTTPGDAGNAPGSTGHRAAAESPDSVQSASSGQRPELSASSQPLTISAEAVTIIRDSLALVSGLDLDELLVLSHSVLVMAGAMHGISSGGMTALWKLSQRHAQNLQRGYVPEAIQDELNALIVELAGGD